ncbi:MAG: hypothetical protein WC373_09660 [Smithella sp.]|jgi:hypothetical protein
MVNYPKNHSELYWRAVNDELPTQDGLYYCYIVGAPYPDFPSDIREIKSIIHFIDGQFFVSEVYPQIRWKRFTVTHWMPRPENPPVS